MAIAVAETKTATAGSGNNITISGFAGLSAGDLLVSQYVFEQTGVAITLPSGWTEINKVDDATAILTSQTAYKVLTAGDVSGNSFQFQQAGVSCQQNLAILHITGQRGASPIAASSGQANGSSTTITAPTATPAIENSLVIFCTASQAAYTSSGYALATSSPSFTEKYDFSQSGVCCAGATGTRPEVTATGSGTATLSSADRNIGQLVIVSSAQTTTTLETVTLSETVKGNLGILIQNTISLTDTITSTIARLWTKLARNVKTWTNQNRD